jgi:hypothetical protein
MLCRAVLILCQIEGAMKSLKDDPEMGEIFNELEAGGPAAMMKYWNNPEVLKKLGETMGGVFDFQVGAGEQLFCRGRAGYGWVGLSKGLRHGRHWGKLGKTMGGVLDFQVGMEGHWAAAASMFGWVGLSWA